MALLGRLVIRMSWVITWAWGQENPLNKQTPSLRAPLTNQKQAVIPAVSDNQERTKHIKHQTTLICGYTV
nr:hypothetical protein Iba_chr02bCG24320 [Ipomoea batatas]GMC65785.1 hypothetical protein Iba_chr02dCG17370 [Ipomoea batatas]GME10992.1 hypothetical protein Iba_scaffold11279CG0010 [Ipomoea batatas]